MMRLIFRVIRYGRIEAFIVVVVVVVVVVVLRRRRGRRLRFITASSRDTVSTTKE
jgi:hypothetical protein